MNRTVLLVDDDLAVLQALLRNWRKEPFHVRTATRAEEALAILARDPVDAVVCDWHMPGMSGTEFLAKVASTYPAVIRIMLTGKANLEVAQGAINNGAVHKFLTKPCDAAALADVLEKALGQKRKDGKDAMEITSRAT
jgi:DNA-binding NtrC family response regulator